MINLAILVRLAIINQRTDQRMDPYQFSDLWLHSHREYSFKIYVSQLRKECIAFKCAPVCPSLRFYLSFHLSVCLSYICLVYICHHPFLRIFKIPR